MCRFVGTKGCTAFEGLRSGTSPQKAILDGSQGLWMRWRGPRLPPTAEHSVLRYRQWLLVERGRSSA